MTGGAQRRPNGIKKRGWYRKLRQAMVDGLECCRVCGLSRLHESIDPGGLRLGHIRPWSVDRCHDRNNLTIVCGSCDQFMGDQDWTGRVASIMDGGEWTPSHPPTPLRRPDLLEATVAVPSRLLAKFGLAT